jgi:hypothetical protein
MAIRAVHVDSGASEVGCGIDRHARRPLQNVLNDLVFTLTTQEPSTNMTGVVDSSVVRSL